MGREFFLTVAKPKEDSLNYYLLLLNSVLNPDSRNLQPSLQRTLVDFDIKLGKSSLLDQDQIHVNCSHWLQ